ncbi:hypothetical protein HMPREF0994_07290 [Lachnospiraceae bacterium 3_1_57FAA_CT1]|nr:hypothetical protein HMPREF0994_07290 [Lachnospiraceae bacterium 3_1_57FAA_CT1]
MKFPRDSHLKKSCFNGEEIENNLYKDIVRWKI